MTGRPPTQESSSAPPADIVTMRQTVAVVLSGDDTPQTADELELRTLLLRGHLMVLVPDVCDLAAGSSGEATGHVAEPQDPTARAKQVQALAEAAMVPLDHLDPEGAEAHGQEVD